MKLALNAMKKSLTDLRSNAKPLAFNGVLVVIVLIGLDIFFPIDQGIEGKSSEELMQAAKEGMLHNLIKSVALLVFSSTFLVFAHKRILRPDIEATTWFALRLGKSEVRFITFTVLIGVIYTACFGLVYVGVGKWVFAGPVDERVAWVASMSWTLPIIIIATMLTTYRFVLFAPLVVLDTEHPMRGAWHLSKGRFGMLATLIAVPMIVQSIFLKLTGPLTAALAIDVAGTNVTESMVLWTVYLAMAAYAAMLLSNTYLEFTREELA